jgi:hypothetical protein
MVHHHNRSMKSPSVSQLNNLSANEEVLELDRDLEYPIQTIN